MIEMNFYVNTSIARAVQDLVKRYNGWFVYTVLVVGKKCNFCIAFDSGDDYRKFSNMLRIVEQPYF